MNTIFLLRHGENHANITREFSYRLVDYPLTEKGVMQAHQAGEYIKNLRLDVIYASPLKRAMETAEIVAQACGLPVVNTLEELRELNVGSLERQTPTVKLWAQHDAVWERWFAGELTARFPDGESYLEAAGRLRQAVRRAFEPGSSHGRRVLLVGHGGIFMIGTHALVEGLSV
jgi:probable phosphoglycerate mutase